MDVKAEMKSRYGVKWVTTSGRCAVTGRVFRKSLAHCHAEKSGICFSAKGISNSLYWNPDYPTLTMLHEAAHALTPSHGHDAVWKQVFAKLLREWGYNPKPSILRASMRMDVRKAETELVLIQERVAPEIEEPKEVEYVVQYDMFSQLVL